MARPAARAEGRRHSDSATPKCRSIPRKPQKTPDLWNSQILQHCVFGQKAGRSRHCAHGMLSPIQCAVAAHQYLSDQIIFQAYLWILKIMDAYSVICADEKTENMRYVCSSRPCLGPIRPECTIWPGCAHCRRCRVILLSRQRGGTCPYLWANIACRADSLRAYPNRTNWIMA